MKYLITSYGGNNDDSNEFKPFIKEEIEGVLGLDDTNRNEYVFYSNNKDKTRDNIIAVFEKSQVWIKEIK